jgi:hypothetical protein
MSQGGRFREAEYQTRFPYSLSGLTAEPSQSANARTQIPRPSKPPEQFLLRWREGRRCVFFVKEFATRIPIIFEAVPVLDPRPENTGPYRFSYEPAGGQSRQGLISDAMRPWRRSDAPARQTGEDSSPTGARKRWARPRGCEGNRANRECGRPAGRPARRRRGAKPRAREREPISPDAPWSCGVNSSTADF